MPTIYKAVVLEDDEQAAGVITDRIAASPYAGDISVSHVSSPSTLADAVEAEGRPDILFADIRMEGEDTDGIQAVRDLFPPGCGTQVVYVTGYEEYCVSVYETDHTYLLLKPVDQATFNKALKRVMEKLSMRAMRMLPVSFKGKTILLDPVDISFVESKLRKVIFHLDGNAYEAYATMADIAQELPPSFVRCHRSVIVNLDAVCQIDANDIIVKTGERIPVGSHYKEAFRESLAGYYGMGEEAFQA